MAGKRKHGYRKKHGFGKRYRKRRNHLYGNHSRIQSVNGIVSANPFPNKYFAILNYSDQFTFTTGAVGVLGTEQVLRLNDMYDTDQTGTGHQPYGYDQMAAIYARYQVTYVDVIITWTDPSADGVFAVASLQSNGNTQSLTGMTFARCREIPFTTVKYINNTGAQVQRMSIKAPLHTIFGVSKQQYMGSPTIYGGQVGSTVSQPCYIRFSAGSSAAAAGVTIQAMVEVKFHAQFWDRVWLGQS